MNTVSVKTSFSNRQSLTPSSSVHLMLRLPKYGNRKKAASMLVFMSADASEPSGPKCWINLGFSLAKTSFRLTKALQSGQFGSSAPEAFPKFSSVMPSVELFGLISSIQL